MLAKILVMLMLLICPCFAKGVAKFPTQVQLETLCVPIKMKIDGDVHWFYWKSIVTFNDKYIDIVYGNDRNNRIMRSATLNFDQAKAQYEKVKKGQNL